MFNGCRLLVNVLANGTQIEKPKDIPYRNSSLTHILRESLGGNAKLTVICAISPDSKYVSFYCVIVKRD